MMTGVLQAVVGAGQRLSPLPSLLKPGASDFTDMCSRLHYGNVNREGIFLYMLRSAGRSGPLGLAGGCEEEPGRILESRDQGGRGWAMPHALWHLHVWSELSVCF